MDATRTTIILAIEGLLYVEMDRLKKINKIIADMEEEQSGRLCSTVRFNKLSELIEHELQTRAVIVAKKEGIIACLAAAGEVK